MRFLRKLHKWLGLIVAIQVLLWTISGLMFAWLDHHKVMAEHSTRVPEAAVLPAGTIIAAPSSWLRDYGTAEVHEVRLSALLDQWVWRIQTADRVELRQAADGKPFVLDSAFVERLARSHYDGDGNLATVSFHATPTQEARDAGAVWEAAFGDAQKTTLYFSASDGRLVAARNSTWRLFDFFWMLHTMDYRGRDNFNNPLVITVGFAALWLSLSGFLLLFKSFRKQDFAFITARRRE